MSRIERTVDTRFTTTKKRARDESDSDAPKSRRHKIPRVMPTNTILYIGHAMQCLTSKDTFVLRNQLIRAFARYHVETDGEERYCDSAAPPFYHGIRIISIILSMRRIYGKEGAQGVLNYIEETDLPPLRKPVLSTGRKYLDVWSMALDACPKVKSALSFLFSIS